MLILPRLPVLGAGCRGPLPTCCGRGRAGVRSQHCPPGWLFLRGAACRGGGGRLSRGGVAFHCCEGRLVSGAVPLPAARLWGRAARTRCPCVPGTGGVGMGAPAAAPSARPEGRLSGSATHLLWARVCGRGGPALSLWLA